MQRQRTWHIYLVIFVCVLLGWQAGSAAAQDEPPEFAGTRECRSCHRSYTNAHELTFHARTLLEADEDDAILADFGTGEDVRAVAFPDGETRAFTAADVAFALGAGRHYQAYVTEVDNGVYRVLPAQWSVTEGAWVPLPLAAEWSDPAYDFNSQCAACHTTNFNTAELSWAETGVQCEACHGPGLNHVELADDAGSSISDSEYEALSSAINFGLDAQTCGQCHVRGTHAESGLPFPVGYHPGGDLLDPAVFTPAPPDDASVWFATGHASAPNMQFNEWLLSSHTNALASAQESDNFEASCLGCHSVAQRRVDYLINEGWVSERDFDPLSVLDVHGFGITCASCHNPHEVDNDDHLIAETYPLCISCHANGEDNDGIHHPVQEMFEGLQLVENIEPVAGAHFTAADGPSCATCHMQAVETKNGPRSSHTFHPVSPGEAAEIEGLQDACTTCHTDVENPVQMQQLIDSVQVNIRDRLVTARDNLDSAAPEWVSRSLAMIEGDGSMGIHNYAYADTLLRTVEVELGLVSATVSDVEVAQQVAAALPPAQPVEAPPPRPLVPPVQGLTGPSIVLLGIFALIILVAAYSFFRRGGQDD